MLVPELTFSSGQVVPISQLTVLIGPNNAGKSRALREILQHLSPGPSYNGLVVKSVRLEPYDSWLEAKHHLNITFTENENAWVGTALSSLLNMAQQQPFHKTPREASLGQTLGAVFESIETAPEPSNQFKQYFAFAIAAYLGAVERISLLQDTPAISANKSFAATNLVQALFQRPTLEAEINFELMRAFGTKIHVDYRAMSQFTVRVGTDIDTLPRDPVESTEQAVLYEQLSQQGDGLRSYAALIAALTVARRPVFLVDEPETALPPPQALAAGRYLGTAARAGQQIIVATHSADILRGILATASGGVTLIRLTRIGDANDARSLNADALRDLALDPLLNATNMLDAVFYASAVVTEADADRAFYEAVSDKVGPSFSIRFTSVQGKHTLSRAIDSYRRMGIRSVAIADIDLLRAAADVRSLANGAGADESLLAEIELLRSKFANTMVAEPESNMVARAASLTQALQQVLADTAQADSDKISEIKRRAMDLTKLTDKWTLAKHGGVENLDNCQREAFQRCAESLRLLGIFVVPVGELEWWLTEDGLRGTTDKAQWIEQALKLVPGHGIADRGPWRFLGNIHDYLADAASHSQQTATS